MDLCRNLLKWSLLPVALGLAVVIGLSPASGQDDGDAAATEAGLQELTRGPVHEAFAEPINFNPKPGIIVKKEPPQPIEELPPEQKPDGDNVAFIAGYFAFDEDKDDWIYISGIWRLVPPGKQWVAGYWHKMDEGWQWVAGYWASARTEEPAGGQPAPDGKQKVEYYPEPPPSLENGANTEPPSVNHSWVPGTYIWYNSHYVWRGGYWIVSQTDWVWIPAHYKWTPCGYVFCEGGWDLVPLKRGVCFAPCYISPTVYLRPRYVYCPRLVVDFGVCSDHFFARPSYCHYYFGDYYDNHYSVSCGIQPWFRFHYSRGHHCPIYSHYRWTYARHDTRWEVELRDRYHTRVAHIDRRPARTFVQQQTVINKITVNKTTNVTNINANQMALAKPLKDVAKADSKVTNLNFAKVEKKDRDLLALNARETRKLTDQRLALESNAAKEIKTRPKLGTGAGTGTGAGAGANINKPLTLELPKSKVESKPLEKLTLGNKPPPLPTGALKPRLTGGTDKPITGGGNLKPGGDKPVIGGGDKPVIGGGNTKPGGDKPVIGGNLKPGGDKPVIGGNVKPGGDKPVIGGGDKPVIGGNVKPGGDKPVIGGNVKPGGDKPIIGGGDKPIIPGGNKPLNPIPGGNKPPTGGSDKPGKPFSDGSGGPPTGGSFKPSGPPTGGSSNPPTGGSFKPPTGGSSIPPSGGSFKPSNPPSGGSGKPPATSGSGSNPPSGGKSESGKKPKEDKR